MLRQAQQQHLSVLASDPVDLLFLQLADSGALANPHLRRAISLAIDRRALRNVIFQGQGEISASVLPDGVSGYSFLFPATRDLGRAQELRAGATPATLVLAVENENAELHLAAERIALNLHEAGIQVKIAFGSGGAKPDMVLRQFHLEASGPRAALDEVAGAIGQTATVTGTDVASIYLGERDLLEAGTVVPLLWLPRAYAISERVRDLRLAVDGDPLIGNAALEDVK
jgi:ABC-type transport system substrate-binding protein